MSQDQSVCGCGDCDALAQPKTSYFFQQRRPGDAKALGGVGAIACTALERSSDELTLQAELPGLAAEDVGVGVENGVLSISGEKKQEVEEEKDGSDYHLVERRYGRFERSFTLPRSVDAGKVKAEFANGVLTVTLPKAEAAKPRRIEVQVSKN